MTRRLHGERPKKSRDATDPPFILSLIQKAYTYGLEWNLMKKMKYHDLLALLIEYDISKVQEHLRQKEQQRQSQKGFTKVQANPKEVASMHRKR